MRYGRRRSFRRRGRRTYGRRRSFGRRRGSTRRIRIGYRL